ncbi:extracellular solute-binding protein [Roseomonas elaeocarpi]|uniref:Extracellular solute-binding protein n=1 Tax=Roseomonas elaeocarpi TaxID=907779 RepID=A0ABV6JND3_9PROT
MYRKRLLSAVLGGLLLTGAAAPSHADEAFRVTYAGSMGVVMDKALGPAFARQEHLTYEGQGEGAYGMARLLASHKVTADVFVSITPGPMSILKEAGLMDEAVPVASTRMVIAYNPQGPYAARFEAASRPSPAEPWWKILMTPGFHLGRTDPASDPGGQNIIFTTLLAEKYYRQPGLAHAILGDPQNEAQISGEGGLLTRLRAGQIDAAGGYESATISAHLPYVVLPDEINLSNPAMARQWYDTVSFSIKGHDGKEQVLHTQPLVFYATVLRNAPHPDEARRFVSFMTSAEGQALLRENGYGPPKGDNLAP